MEKKKRVTMLPTTYEELLVYIIKRLTVEYGSVKKFSEHEDAKRIGYTGRDGELIPAGRIMTYLSYGGSGEKNGKNVKFLACIATNLWGIRVYHQQVIKKSTILESDFKSYM